MAAVCLSLCALLPSAAQAAEPATVATLLDPLFQPHAVLQRDQPLRVWGRTLPGEQVDVQLAGKRSRVRADDRGHWQASLPALPAGGPYSLIVHSGARQQHVDDMLIGDVWLCGGQSNMELPVWRTLDARSEIAGAANDRIRLLSVSQQGSPAPVSALSADVRWSVAGPDSVREFSAACYYFARELQKTVDVPMGLIHAAWGGSRIQAWMSAGALRSVGDYESELAILDHYAREPTAALEEWGRLWQRWWSQQAGIAADDQPWTPAGDRVGEWQAAPPQLGAWEHWGVPALADFNGMLWYRATVLLSAEQAAQAAVLALGPADEIDMSWVNGRAVGSTYGAGDDRAYPLPAGLLHAGENTVVINVLDTYREGGLAGPATRHVLRLADGTALPLQHWRYRRMPANLASPPPAPWQTAAGLSTLYNGMIAPLGQVGLRGVLWYQGESNTADAARYATLLRALRRDWRVRFGADLPWLIVQLAGYGMPPAQAGESDWAALREAQRHVAGEDPRSGLAVAVDIGDRYDIHPGNKQELARRLARAARHVVYADSASASGPVPAAVRREGETVVVEFADVDRGLMAYGADGPIGFQLCGAKVGSCRYAQATIRGRHVVLQGADLQAATRVRYCWADNPICTLFDSSGLPAGPFEMAVAPPPSAMSTPASTSQATVAKFDWFQYSGDDAVFKQALPPGYYRNPILAGFHADPSITRAGDRYYLVNSSFTYFPGIPVWESRDLVNWTLLGHAIDRPGPLNFDGLSVSRGIFAPAISHHDGVFYIVTTAVDSGGNFLLTATDPAGPWSDPVWLPSVNGIDPSLFFDDDGRAYLLNNDEPAQAPRYDGHRAIWMQEIDLSTHTPVGPRRVLLDGGVNPAANPIWIEGPHLFKHEGWYYLTCAEGGTGPQHSQVVLRSRQLWGPFQAYPHNPILTQRDLPETRAHPITNAGHADLLQTPAGDWWAVFLASRNYDGVHYNTGRETFLLPVSWRDGWPTILEAGKTIPYVAAAPAAATMAASTHTGNFSWRDDFSSTKLDPAWRYVRVPDRNWADLQSQPGWLSLEAGEQGLDSLRSPHFLARRQQHTRFHASTQLAWPSAHVEAGLAAFQNEQYWLALGVRQTATGGEVYLERNRGGVREMLAVQPIQTQATLLLLVDADGGNYNFGFDTGNGPQWLQRDVDGSLLSTDVAGGFVGASIGPFAILR